MNEISKMRENAIVITVTPRKLQDGRETIDKEVQNDMRFFDNRLMNETVFVHMAVIHYFT